MEPKLNLPYASMHPLPPTAASYAADNSPQSHEVGEIMNLALECLNEKNFDLALDVLRESQQRNLPLHLKERIEQAISHVLSAKNPREPQQEKRGHADCEGFDPNPRESKMMRGQNPEGGQPAGIPAAAAAQIPQQSPVEELKLQYNREREEFEARLKTLKDQLQEQAKRRQEEMEKTQQFLLQNQKVLLDLQVQLAQARTAALAQPKPNPQTAAAVSTAATSAAIKARVPSTPQPSVLKAAPNSAKAARGYRTAAAASSSSTGAPFPAAELRPIVLTPQGPFATALHSPAVQNPALQMVKPAESSAQKQHVRFNVPKESKSIPLQKYAPPETTPLHQVLAKLGNKDDLMPLIHRHGVNSRDAKQQVPLHVAVWNMRGPLVLSTLLDNGAEANVQDSEGNTPLHLALMRNAVPAIRTLLERGAKTDIKNNAGKTAYDLALDGKESKIIELFPEPKKSVHVPASGPKRISEAQSAVESLLNLAPDDDEDRCSLVIDEECVK